MDQVCEVRQAKLTVVRWATDVCPLRPIAEEWAEVVRADVFELAAIPLHLLVNLTDMVVAPDQDVLVLLSDEQPVGLMGLVRFVSPIGPDVIAEEHYWYVLKDFRGRGAIMLLNAAQNWAKAMGCSHLKMNASMLASDLHDGVCKLYEHRGMQKFETTYMKRL